MLFVLLFSLLAHADAWRDTLDQVVPAVVSLRVAATRSFDTQPATNAIATGFVVDAERGLILTNRHVVGPGPVTAEAVFQDNEEVDLVPVYRDPVHDFGIFRFDPADVHFMEVQALELAPEAAQVGAEIRIVGSDAGEKISILSGILARLDRAAPRYGRGRYNDFNTFYMQAASGTSGGSSGSPVIDASGRVVALNAGSRVKGASSFFLPLDRVARALRLIQAGLPVPRGTLQTTFSHQPYDELRRLGLSAATEAQVRQRFPDGTGMLVVSDVVPAGPASGSLQPGDIVVGVDGTLVDRFVPLEARLDDRVGEGVQLQVQRGGEQVQVDLTVGDLHGITPHEYLQVGDAVLHPLSYQVARSYVLPVRGLTLATPGYLFARLGAGVVLSEIAGHPVRDLDDAARLLATQPEDSLVPVAWFSLDDPSRRQVDVIRMERRWFSFQRCWRDDDAGVWPCEDGPPALSVQPPPPRSTAALPGVDAPSRVLASSQVTVRYDIPYRVDGVYGLHFRGTGLVVDAARGWVLVDRDTVPIALGQAHITFGASVEVPARVLWLHPAHNMAVLAYDPALIGDTPVRSARFTSARLQPGDEVWQVGLSANEQIVSRKTRVGQVDALYIPPPDPPYFRPVNVEVIQPQDASMSTGGVLADRRGRVSALWASYVELDGKQPSSGFRGLPAAIITDALDALRAGRADPWPSLGVELWPIPLVEARNRGLGDAQVNALESADPRRRMALVVQRLVAGSPAATLLREGDLLVSVDGQPVTHFLQVERAALKGPVRLTVWRDGAALSLTVPPHPLSGQGTTAFLRWAGAMLQQTPPSVAAQHGIPAEGVYVSWYWYGSPAARYRLRPTYRIVAVDEVPTPDLAAFAVQVAGRPDGAAVRLRTVDLRGRVRVITLRLDQRYWPTIPLHLDEGGWRRGDAAAETSD